MSLGVLIKQILEILILSSEKMGFYKGTSKTPSFISKKKYHSLSHFVWVSFR